MFMSTLVAPGGAGTSLHKLETVLPPPPPTKFPASPQPETTTATSVRVREGKRLVTDGPFAETREALGGYYLVDARDLDEAMSIAERIPGAKYGTVEIRPVLEIKGLPQQ